MHIAVMLFSVLFWTFLLVSLIYLIIKRSQIKDKETFEKRDN